MGKYQLDEKQKKLNQNFTGQKFKSNLSQKEKIEQLKKKMLKKK